MVKRPAPWPVVPFPEGQGAVGSQMHLRSSQGSGGAEMAKDAAKLEKKKKGGEAEDLWSTLICE